MGFASVLLDFTVLHCVSQVLIGLWNLLFGLIGLYWALLGNISLFSLIGGGKHGGLGMRCCDFRIERVHFGVVGFHRHRHLHYRPRIFSVHELPGTVFIPTCFFFSSASFRSCWNYSRHVETNNDLWTIKMCGDNKHRVSWWSRIDQKSLEIEEIVYKARWRTRKSLNRSYKKEENHPQLLAMIVFNCARNWRMVRAMYALLDKSLCRPEKMIGIAFLPSHSLPLTTYCVS